MKMISLACLLVGVSVILNYIADSQQTDMIIKMEKQIEAQQNRIDTLENFLAKYFKESDYEK